MVKKLYTIVFSFFIAACVDFGQTQTLWVKNIQGENIYVEVDGLKNAKHHKLAIIEHGLASNIHHAAVQSAKKAFLNNDYVVITFDARYSLGKGNNEVEKVRLSTFVEDMETVANWAKTQAFYSEPFAVSGHSLGGASVIEFAYKYPKQVNLLLPITPLISGRLWEKSCMENMTDFCRHWKQNGVYKYTDEQNHKTAIIPYYVVISCNDYDAYTLVKNIEAQTLLIAAENDIVINPNDVQQLSKKIMTAKTVTIKSSDHNFSNKKNQNDLYQAINSFLQ